MDCFGLQKLLKRTCCSCGSGDSTASDKVEITKITKKKNSSDNPSLSLKGNSADQITKELPINGNDNPAYHDDDANEKITSKSIGDKVVNEQPRLTTAFAYERQVSDVSNLSDFPLPSGKGLTEMVMEEIERSFASERDAQELEKSFHERETTHVEHEEKIPSGHTDFLSEISDTQETPIDIDNDSEIPPTEVELPTDISPQLAPPECHDVPSKDLEWRKKLMEDLDDDEEFLSSSDEEDAGISRDTCNKDSEETPDQIFAESENMDADHSTKHTNGLSRGTSESSGIIKCGGAPVVLDMGSYEIKAGMAGEYEPSRVFRNVLGKWRPQVGEAYSEAYGDILFGDDALTKHNALSLHYTLQDGVVTDWKNFESICDWTLSDCLDVDIKEHPLLLSEPAMVSKAQREKQLEVVMEALHCPMVQFRSQEVLSALYAGTDVAVVVNSGHACTEIVPVYYGYPITNAIQQVRVGGQHITEYLGRLLLRERGINFSSVSDLLLLDSLKCSYAEIRSDEHLPEASRKKTIHHELPDGGILELGSEIYECTEPLYNPQLLGHEGPGLYEAIKDSVKRLDSEIRGDMKSSVLLTGGNCSLKFLDPFTGR